MKFIVDGLKETKELAQHFASQLKVGDVVLLSGDLGAGKTTFTQFVFNALGVQDVVNSPTFSILKSYESKLCVLNHFDAYRITSEEAVECGFDEVLSNKNEISFVEWAEMIQELIPKKTIKVNIRIIDTDKREFEIEL